MPCFYVPELTDQHKIAILKGEEFHHAVHVFRKKTDDEIIFSNGAGCLFEAVITSIDKKQLVAAIVKYVKKIKSEPRIALAFALLKNKHDHLLIEKTTELGVQEFFPYTSVRSVRKSADNTIERFQKTIVSAGKQCDNAFFPKIAPVKELMETIERVKQNNYLPIVAYEQENGTFISDIFSEKLLQNYCLFIGPEGGFTEPEVLYLKQQNVPLISLGNHILRAETAAICGISFLLQKCLEFDRKHY
jgi:16S rRNA (uracil1498-N3)-methyltransferase